MSLNVSNFVAPGTSIFYLDIDGISQDIKHVHVKVPYGKIKTGSTTLLHCFSQTYLEDRPQSLEEYLTKTDLRLLPLDLHRDDETGFHFLQGTVPVRGDLSSEVQCAFQSSLDISVMDDENATAATAAILVKDGDDALSIATSYQYFHYKDKFISSVRSDPGPFVVSLQSIKSGTHFSQILFRPLTSPQAMDDDKKWSQKDVECVSSIKTAGNESEVTKPIKMGFDFDFFGESYAYFDEIRFGESVDSFTLSCPLVTVTSAHPGHPFVTIYAQNTNDSQHQTTVGLFGDTSNASLAGGCWLFIGVVASMIALMY